MLTTRLYKNTKWICDFSSIFLFYFIICFISCNCIFFDIYSFKCFFSVFKYMLKQLNLFRTQETKSLTFWTISNNNKFGNPPQKKIAYIVLLLFNNVQKMFQRHESWFLNCISRTLKSTTNLDTLLIWVSFYTKVSWGHPVNFEVIRFCMLFINDEIKISKF